MTLSVHYRGFLAELAGEALRLIELDPEQKLADLLELVEIPKDFAYLVILDGTLVNRAHHHSTELRDGSVVSLTPLHNGG